MITWEEAFGPVIARTPRRPSPKKPCTWCVRRWQMPATHVSKWPEWITVEDEYERESHRWFPSRRVLLCALHVRFAARYEGVRVYRFRKV